jgi:glycosyltransferase involved in cell wall biosynthesis
MNPVDLSIIVAVRNQRPHNQLFLEALNRSSSVRTELLVVDNSSSDGSAEFFRGAGALVIATGGNLCYPETMNLGLEKARGEYVAFLNNDLVVSPGWDEGLITALDTHQLPIVSPIGIERTPREELTRTVQERWRLVKGRIGPVRTADDLRAAVHLMYGDWEGFCRQVKQTFEDRLVSGIVGSCVLARRSFMEGIGGWDSRVQAADWDLYLRLCQRAEMAGDIRPPMIAAWIYVHHYVQATRRGERTPFTCTHPRLTVQEKWGEAAIRRWFFDPSLLVARPRFHRDPVAYLQDRARRLTIVCRRALALVGILFRGLPRAEDLLSKVGQGGVGS